MSNNNRTEDVMTREKDKGPRMKSLSTLWHLNVPAPSGNAWVRTLPKAHVKSGLLVRPAQ